MVVSSTSRDPDLAPFVGPVHLGESILVVPRGGTPVLGFYTGMEREEAAASGFALLDVEALRKAGRRCDDPAEARSRRWEWALGESGVTPGAIGVAGRHPAGTVAIAGRRLAATGWELADFARELMRLRRSKTSWEREEIGRAAEGAVAAFRAVADELARARSDEQGRLSTSGGEALTAAHLRRRIAHQLADHALEQPEGNIVSAGRQAAVPHTQGDSDRRLRAGEPIVVDLYPKGHLFADCTRTFCVGEPPDELEAAHHLVYRALTESTRELAPGRSGAELQGAVCDRFEAAGWETARGASSAEKGYVHGLGHGLGYELHELPTFRGDEDTVLEANDVFTLEPGLYDPGAGLGVRLEDLFVMTESGVECLTPLPYELDPRRWSRTG